MRVDRLGLLLMQAFAGTIGLVILVAGAAVESREFMGLGFLSWLLSWGTMFVMSRWR